MKKLLLLFAILILGNFYVSAQDWRALGSDAVFGIDASKGVYDILEIGNDVYAVGGFHAGDGISTYNYVAYWDGASWNQMGSGFAYNASDGVFSIVEYGGDIYIGGLFTYDDGTNGSFSNLARWDDVTNHWLAVGTSSNGAINDLIVYAGSLYAGGDFSSIGGVTTDYIAEYDGTIWSALGAGGTNGEVNSMTLFDGDLIVGGDYSTVDNGNILVRNVAAFDGANWARLGGSDVEGGGGTSDTVYDMVEFDGGLYVGGDFNLIYNGLSSTSVSGKIAEWTGTVWSVPSKTISSINKVNSLTVFDGNMYAGNNVESTIHFWNGSPIFNWDSNSGFPNNILYNNGSEIYAGGFSAGVYFLADPAASFSASTYSTCAGEEITFTDQSSGTNTITAWNWTFEGGTPATSTDQNPVVSFAAVGSYDVTLEVTSSDGTNTYTIEDVIMIADDVAVITDPSSTSVCSSENATFNAGGSGTNGITYQWQINDGSGYVDLVDESNVISGATVSQLTFINPSINLDGVNVKCIITNVCGTNSVATAEALMNVTEAPSITDGPYTQAMCEDGGDVEFNVISTGATTYQWQYYLGSNTYADLNDAGAYSGTTTAILSIADANNTTILNELFDDDFSDGITSALYRCVLTGNGCTTYSALQPLTIYEAPTLSEDPMDITKCDSGNGINTSFSVTSTPSIAGLTYQWQVDDGSGFADVVDDAVYTGSTSNTLSLTEATSVLSGNVFKCLVGNCTSPVESNTATLIIYNLPGVVQNTVDTKVCDEGDATFTVEATGDNLSYQWQELIPSGNYVDIVDNAMYSQFGNSLEITGVTLSMNQYVYRCVVSSGDGCSRNFGAGRLFVYKKQTLTNNTSTPTDLNVCDGGDATLRVNTSSGYNAGFHKLQWQVDFTGTGTFTDLSDDDEKYAGVTTRELEITGANVAMDQNQYRCVVTNCDGSTASDPETLTVLQLPLVIEHPQSQTICLGEQVTFTALATGSDLTYQWWVDPNGNGNFQTVSNPSASPDYTFTAERFDGYIYKCIATAGDCTASAAESFEATLTVHETIIESVSEINVSICAGESTTFSVIMTNPEGLSFQWSDANGDLTDDAVYSGATTSELHVNAPTTAINSYTVSISGDCGNTSFNYQLLVYGLATPVVEPQLSDPSNPQLFVSNTNDFQLGVDNWEWFLDGNSYQSTGTTSAVSLDQAGSYTVVATINSCSHPESEAVVIIITGFENSLSAKGINFYPNPVENQLTLEMGNDFSVEKGATIILTNVNGKEVFSKNYDALQNRKAELDMSNLESGIYLVRVINGDKLTQYKIRKQ